MLCLLSIRLNSYFESIELPTLELRTLLQASNSFCLGFTGAWAAWAASGAWAGWAGWASSSSSLQRSNSFASTRHNENCKSITKGNKNKYIINIHIYTWEITTFLAKSNTK